MALISLQTSTTVSVEVEQFTSKIKYYRVLAISFNSVHATLRYLSSELRNRWKKGRLNFIVSDLN